VHGSEDGRERHQVGLGMGGVEYGCDYGVREGIGLEVPIGAISLRLSLAPYATPTFGNRITFLKLLTNFVARRSCNLEHPLKPIYHLPRLMLAPLTDEFKAVRTCWLQVRPFLNTGHVPR
jgi:hypothetical protein